MPADWRREPLWRMAGVGIVVPLTLPLDAAAPLVPHGLDPVLVPLTSRVPGVLFAARYDSTSTLEYSELGMALLVRPSRDGARRGRASAWITHLWVDSRESVEAGQLNWGLSKAMARFTWERDGRRQICSARTEAGPLISLTAELARFSLNAPVKVRCVSGAPGTDLLSWTVRSRSSAGRCSVRLDGPQESALAPYRLERLGQGMSLDPLHLSIQVPEVRLRRSPD